MRKLIDWMRLAMAAGLLCFGAQAPAAESYPQRTVRIVVSLPPGSGADTTARFIARHLSQSLGQPFVVENRPGANSFIAARAVAEAAPDGYTLFVASNSPMVTNAAVFRQLPYDPVKDFAPVAGLARFPMVLVVPAGSPHATLQQLVAAVRSAPGKLNYASGTPTYQVAMERFHARNGIKATAVPYKGTGPAVTDLAAGVVEYSIAEVSAVLPLIRSGKLRALAVASAERHKSLPEVPTVAEAGTPDFESYAWTGVFFPAGVPAPIVQRVSAAVRSVMTGNEGRAFIDSQGGTVFTGTPEELRRFQLAEIESTRLIVQAANIPIE